MIPELEQELGRCIFLEAQDAFFVISPETLQFLEVNPAAQRLTGKRRKELQQLTLADLFSPATTVSLVDLIQACQSTSCSVTRAGYAIYGSDDSEIPVQISACRIHIHEEALGLLIVRDLSQIQQAQKAIEESELRAKRLAEMTDVVPWEVDSQSKSFTWIGEQAVSVFGYPLVEWYQPRFWESIIHPEDKDWVTWNSEEQSKSQDTFTLQYRIQAKNGDTLWVEDYVNVLRNEDNSPERLYGFFVDITQKKRFELQLKEQERHFRSLVEDGLDVIFLLNANGTIRYVTPNVSRVLGFAQELIQGRRFTELLRKEKKQEFEANILRSKSIPGSHFSGEVNVAHQEGSLRLWEYTARNHLHNEVTNAIVVNCRDITNRRAIEEDRQKLERELYQAAKLESLGVMAAGIAHDFNNLLTIIMGNLTLVSLAMPEGSPAREQLAAAEEASMLAANLTSQMLAYSGHGHRISRSIRIEPIVRESLDFLQNTVGKQTQFELDIDDDLPPIIGDADQMKQIIVNLVSNGIEASEPDAGKLTISVSKITINPSEGKGPKLSQPLTQGDYLCIEVKDYGTGIDASAIDRIFDPFFTTKFTGRGLGLSVVLGIAHSHGGAIQLESEPTVGTTVRVYLPSENREKIKHDSSPKVQIDSSSTPLSILVIEDEMPIQKLLRVILERAGHTVELASDGMEGMSQLNAQSFDLVLLDLSLPSMAGDEVYRKIQDKYPTIPIVVMTSVHEERLRELLNEGERPFVLQKPFTPDGLYQLIAEASQEWRLD